MPTEVYRPRRSEYPRPTTVEEEMRRQNADRFIDSYIQQITYPRLLLNHVGTIPFESDQERLREREACWAEYLYQEPPPPSEWIWGRTILAEVVSQQIMQATLSRMLEASGMFVDLVPTSIDGSTWKGVSPYQKGIDLCMTQMVVMEGETVMSPICGIDVTVGGQTLVDHKRNRPGLQAQIAIPAIVMPLGSFVWGENGENSFNSYLDTHARTEILEKGVCTPFYGLDEKDVKAWQHILRREMKAGLNHCRDGLKKEFPGYLSPMEYPYIEDVRKKIKQTKKLVYGQPIPLPASS